MTQQHVSVAFNHQTGETVVTPDPCHDPCPDILESALLAIAEALKEPDGGSYWPARQYLDQHDKYHDDLDGTRVLWQVANLALKLHRERAASPPVAGTPTKED